MFSQKLSTPIPKCHKKCMSYTFGPHMIPQDHGYYFEADNRIIRTSSDKIRRFDGPVPAWLVADWMLAQKRGEPISKFAQEVLKEKQTSTALIWLNSFISQ